MSRSLYFLSPVQLRRGSDRVALVGPSQACLELSISGKVLFSLMVHFDLL